ncbi:TatD family deoxyribonuclease [Candidatus Parcubacteria bacterium]|nr:MAG: TatD family deoxyribonuclease [Candidatus Parcubacteria bacterium]
MLKLKLIDSHTHIQFPQYDNDREEIINRALKQGIGLINIGTDLETSQKAIELAQKYESLWATVGLHPNDSPQEPWLEKEYGELVKNPKVAAVGETGLDFFRTKDKKDQLVQYEKFEAQVFLANKFKKPLTFHIRDAYEEAADFLGKHKAENGGAIHCFTGSWEQAKHFLDMGFFISFSGIVTFSKELAGVAIKIPLEQLLVETDAPYLAPEPHRGKRNEPAWVELVAKKVAEIKGLSLNEVCQKTLQNTFKLFKLE